MQGSTMTEHIVLTQNYQHSASPALGLHSVVAAELPADGRGCYATREPNTLYVSQLSQRGAREGIRRA